MALKNALKDKSEAQYRQGFRQFSEALNKATIAAAQKATQWMIDNAVYQTNGKDYLPMRPIVLGGDDLTLLCRADLALTYSEIFCKEFEQASKQALETVYNKYLKDTDVKAYLTASGGILYNKAGHPFTHSHHLVEELCDHAKKLTKSVNKTATTVGPAALAFYRLSNSTSASFESLFKQSQTFELAADKSISMGVSAYFVDNDQANNLTTLKELADKCRNKKLPLSMPRWRQMATQLAMGNLDEANAIFNRALLLASDKKKEYKLTELIETLTPPQLCQSATFNNWYWQNAQQQMTCLINDLLIVDHFRPVTAENGEKQ